MADLTATDEELAALAKAYGLEKLRALDPATFANAHSTAATLADRMPGPEALEDEPAHICVFTNRGPRS